MSESEGLEPERLWGRLLAAQREFSPPGLSGVNTAQGWRFVEGGRLLAAAMDALAGAGLVGVFSEIGDSDPARVRVQLRVTDPVSGESESWRVVWPVERGGAQARGAALTYARKQLAIGLFPSAAQAESDPDEHAQPAAPQAAPRPPRGRPDHVASDSQRRFIGALFSKLGVELDGQREYIAGVLGDYGGSLNAAQASDLIDHLQEAVREQSAVSEPAVGAGEDLSEVQETLDG